MHRSRGFTLLEVLVTLVILAIGLLGLAGLMTTSLRNNQGAWQHSQASWLAYDILDRMRANRTVAENNGYRIIYGQTAPSGSTTADNDLQQWTQEITTALPAGQGQVDLLNNGIITIHVRWDDSRSLALKGTNTATGYTYLGGTQTFTFSTQL